MVNINNGGRGACCVVVRKVDNLFTLVVQYAAWAELRGIARAIWTTFGGARLFFNFFGKNHILENSQIQARSDTVYPDNWGFTVVHFYTTAHFPKYFSLYEC